MAKKIVKPMNSVQRLISSLESRIKTYEKNKKGIIERYLKDVGVQDQKISDCRLQLKALRK